MEHLIAINHQVEKMFSCSRKKLLGLHTSELSFEERTQKIKGEELINKLFSKGAVSGVEQTWLKLDGETIDIEMNIALLKDRRGETTGSVAIIRDITERKEAEEKLIKNQEQLRFLASQLTKVEEQERRKIASYLHDHLGQELFAIKLQLEQLKKSFPEKGVVNTLENVIDKTNRMMRNMRTMSYELSPPILYELGLKAALEWIVEEMSTTHAISITFHDDGEPKPLKETTNVLLFQAVRELLNNVVRHAKAKNVKITLAKDNSMVVVHVSDDGVGFVNGEPDPSREKNQGFGLYSIKERLKYIDGMIDVESKYNHGVNITLKVPIEG